MELSASKKPGYFKTHQFVVLQLFGVNAIRVPDASIQFSYTHTFGSKAVQVTHGVQAHVTKALHQNIKTARLSVVCISDIQI